MLDTIIYIPTILAYTFITLLVVILCFIVIYVSHKVYISVYDNLPVLQTVSRSLLSLDDHAGKLDKSLREDSTRIRKSKTALRIIVTLEPCYLAYVIFETGNKEVQLKQNNDEKRIIATTLEEEQQQQEQQDKQTNQQQQQQSKAHNIQNEEALNTTESQVSWRHRKFIKYFDRLSSIPIIKQCPQRK